MASYGPVTIRATTPSRASSYGGPGASRSAQTGCVRPLPVPLTRLVRRTRRRGGAGHVTAAPVGCARLLRQILNELVAGLEQFLLVDDVVAVEDGAGGSRVLPW